MRRLTLPILVSGALIDIQVGLSNARRSVYLRTGLAIPSPVHATFLIDTGASKTLVDEALMRTLQLTPTSSTLFHSTSTKGVALECDEYDVQLILGGIANANTLRLEPLSVMATALINQPFQGLLGRDVLNRMQLGWNGPAQSVTIDYV